MKDPQETILVTGANTGLGLEIVKALCSSETKYNIFLAGRSIDKARQAVDDMRKEFPSSPSKVSAIQVDIEDDVSIENSFEEIQTEVGRLDVLINNAGAQFESQLAASKISMRAMWNASWNVNVTGTHILTSTFAPLLLASPNPRLIFITSGTATLAGTENRALAVNKFPPNKGGWPKQGFNLPAYRSSKTGLNMVMREWHRMLSDDGVKVWCVSPGLLVTGLGGNPEMIRKFGGADPAIGGKLVREVVEGERDADVGKVVMRDRVVQDW
ncbi:hypothetical protein MMC25_001261 [Agyrium rufum]|nr:hypothetical protein [Agyrium rufum]